MTLSTNYDAAIAGAMLVIEHFDPDAPKYKSVSILAFIILQAIEEAQRLRDTPGAPEPSDN